MIISQNVLRINFNTLCFQVLTAVCAVISKVAINYENAGIISEYDVAPLLAKLTNIVSEHFL